MAAKFFRRQSKVSVPSSTSLRIGSDNEIVRVPAPASTWDSVVFDVETTGLFPGGSDRIVEVAALRLSPDGDVIDRFDTLINPKRDIGATHIHGITATDVQDAPPFDSVVGDIASFMAGAALVAHNASFDTRFLAAEFGRAGHDFPDTATVCTMQLPARVGIRLPAVNLQACCQSFGIAFSEDDAHRAMYDTERTAELYLHLVGLASERPPKLTDLGATTPVADHAVWPTIRPSGFRHPREIAQHARNETFGYLERLANTVGARRGINPDHAPYVALLDRVLEDGIVDEPETEALVDLAHDLGLGTSEIQQANRDYLRYLIEAAWDDGVVTDTEERELGRAAHLLGIGSTDFAALITTLKPRQATNETVASSNEIRGMTVCFTGTMSKPRGDLQELAETAGLTVQKNVTKALDILVVADANSQSSKATKARSYGTRIMSEEAFLRKIGAGI